MSTSTPQERAITYMSIDELEVDPRNPKTHDEETVAASIERFGVMDPIVRDDRTGYIISGHGRRKALLSLKALGGEPPAGVLTDPASGSWLIPVLTGWESVDDDEAAAALIALNRTTELGGWDEEVLLELLDDLGNMDGGLIGVGYEARDVTSLRTALEELNEPDFDVVDLSDLGGGSAIDEEGRYTRDTTIPHYEPKADDDVDPESLADLTAYRRLLAKIDDADDGYDLGTDTVEFLKLAAARHIRFDYARIADYYANAEPIVQELMEESALVVLDTGDAIRHGFLKVSGRLGELMQESIEDRAAADAEGAE